jgi:hypothetical protein
MRQIHGRHAAAAELAEDVVDPQRRRAQSLKLIAVGNLWTYGAGGRSWLVVTHGVFEVARDFTSCRNAGAGSLPSWAGPPSLEQRSEP